MKGLMSSEFFVIINSQKLELISALRNSPLLSHMLWKSTMADMRSEEPALEIKVAPEFMTVEA